MADNSPAVPDLDDPQLIAVLSAARAEARRRRHDRVATRHLLLGILAVPRSSAADILGSLGADPDHLRRRVESSLPRRRRPVGADRLPWSANAARAVAAAATATRGRAAAGTEHLLMALLDLQGGVARLLFEDGITAATVRSQWFERSTRASTALGFLRVNPHSDIPVYQQIVDRVREAVASARLSPGDRLPTVRQLASDLEVAPGTTARAYQELEQLGVVVTGGARGTRIAEPRLPNVSDPERIAALVELLRPVAVSAAYLGATPSEIHRALDDALAGISLQRATPL